MSNNCDEWKEELAARGKEFPTVDGAWDEATRQAQAETVERCRAIFCPHCAGKTEYSELHDGKYHTRPGVNPGWENKKCNDAAIAIRGLSPDPIFLDRERLKARLFQHVCDCDKCQGVEYRHVKCPKGMELERELAALHLHMTSTSFQNISRDILGTPKEQ